MSKRTEFQVQFDSRTIKHLGIQMYSSLPPVIGELIANAWDADASSVSITVPTTPLCLGAQITIQDDGCGMSDEDIEKAYLVVGRDRRKENNDAATGKNRKVMGRKGIGKFSAFGIASEVEIETVKSQVTTRLILRYADFERSGINQPFKIPSETPTGEVLHGTRIILRGFTKYQYAPINIDNLRKGIALRFSVIGEDFSVLVNNRIITPDERDLTRLLEKDYNDNPYKWSYDNTPIDDNKHCTVSGWIGTLDRTNASADGIRRGIVVMARGKLVQEPFVFDASVGQQFALSYLVGELHAEFVDEENDTIGTSRNALVWDDDVNAKFREWGQKEVNKIAREWAEKRREHQNHELEHNPIYAAFLHESQDLRSTTLAKTAEKLIKTAIAQNPNANVVDFNDLITFTTDFMRFDAFGEVATEIVNADNINVEQIINLFRDWEVLEAKEMARVTEGRIKTIKKLEDLIVGDALEVPTLHNFLKEFPWVLDPRWSLIADEPRFSDLLKNEYPISNEPLGQDRRIDFLCVSEGTSLVVVEIKRPSVSANKRSLEQIEEYVGFMREHIQKTTDERYKTTDVVGYLLVGDVVNIPLVRQKIANLQNSKIYVLLYKDLLKNVEKLHQEFLDRFRELKERKSTRMRT